MKLPVSWMRQFVDVDADPPAVAARLGACGFEAASVNGDVIDFDITANRPDCLSVYGLAREAAVAFDTTLLSPPAGRSASIDGPAAIPVSIGDAGCGRYTLAVADVHVGPSPAWLADRLVAAGVRPINNIVDVTNYVMIETGHPLHAFDAARLAGPEIRVRRARPGESLVTLDGHTRTLDDTMLVIADRERPVAIAGVMGGAASEVSASTARIALESAWFLPASVRATSRRLGLKTEASARFERGADPAAPRRALERALALLVDIGAGAPVGGIADVYPRPASPVVVLLRRPRIAALLGDTVPDAEVLRILTRLGFTLVPVDEGWRVTVPSFRVDVAREADLIEEIGRHWGFDRIPATFPALRAMPRPMATAVSRDRRLREALTGAGLQEACTFTFIEREAAAPFVGHGSGIVKLANPLSEKFAVLRPSLLPGLLDALVYNRRRETDDVRLFEIGAVATPGGEAVRVGWILAGTRGDHWSGASASVDVFDAVGLGVRLGEAFGVEIASRPATAAPWFQPGRAAELVRETAGDAIPLGTAGQIAPAIVQARGLAPSTIVVAGELDPAALAAMAETAPQTVAPLPRFPSIVRDLSILVEARLPAADVRGTIRSAAPDTLVSVREFDRYAGAGVPDGQVSLSLRLTFRHHGRTLTDAEVQRDVARIVAALAAAHGAVVRGQAGSR